MKSLQKNEGDKEKAEKRKNEKNENEALEGNFFSNLIKLFSFADYKDILLIVLGSLSAMLNGSVLPLLGLVFGKMTNTMSSVEEHGLRDDSKGNPSISSLGPEKVTVEEFDSEMKFFSLCFGIICVIVVISVFLQILCWELACERQVFKLRKKFFQQILRQDSAWFDVNEDGDLSQKLSDDLERIKEGIGSKISLLIQYASTLICGLAVGFATCPRLSFCLVLLAPVIIGINAFIAKESFGASAREQIRYGIAGGIASEVLNCLNIVVSFGGHEREIERYSKAIIKGTEITKKRYIIISIMSGVVLLINYSTFAGAFWYGSRLIEDNFTTSGQIFTVFFSVLNGAFSIGNAIPFLASVSAAAGAGSTIFDIIERVPDIDPYSENGIKLDKINGNIKFEDVSFHYPSRPDIQVLNNLTLEIEAGKMIALVGPSGSGKSTVVDLILRFYDVCSGKVFIDNVNVPDLNINWFRQQVGYVSQEPILFGLTIEENIKYGCNDSTHEDVVRAATQANIHSFIKLLPSGYETKVGDRGTFLSGGQKQRIAIARALIKNPSILLLDEATSALDCHSEAAVQKALENAMKDRTTIVVAHRLSTIRNADLIVTLKDGVLHEKGTHDELMAKEGLYFSLVSLQKIQKTAENEIQANEDFESFKLRRGHRASERRKSVLVRSNTKLSVRRKSVTGTPEELDLKELIKEVSFVKLMVSNPKERCFMILAVLGYILSGVTLPAFNSSYADAFHTYTLRGRALEDEVFLWTFIYIGFAIVAGFSMFLAVITSSYATENVIADLRIKAFTKTINQPINWFDIEVYCPSRILNSLSRDPPIIKGAAGFRGGQVITGGFVLLTSFLIAFIADWRLALILSVSIPFIGYTSWRHIKLLKKRQFQDEELMSQAAEVASEAIQNYKTVQSLGQEKHFQQRYNEFLSISYEEGKKEAFSFSLVFSAGQVFVFIMYSVAFVCGSHFIISKQSNPTSVYRAFFAMTCCATFVGMISSYLKDLARAKISFAFFNHLVKLPNENESSETDFKPEIKGAISFEKLDFRYPSRMAVKVLDGFSLEVEAGQTVALVGASGCGKSTIISILERFYCPSAGRIKIDGMDMKMICIKWLRQNISLVTQEPVLFSSTIKYNIAYGAVDPDNVPMEKIIQAAKGANIHEFICNLPQGYDTEVGDRGTMLSGGQKQRIAIARALIRDPKILLLDEATSALDTESEKVVQEALDKASSGRTCIIIAHRLSTIRNANIIVVIERGKVVEKGNHSDLMAINGFYAALVRQNS